MNIKDLKKKRKSLHDMQMIEYKTRGNTERSQELFAEIEKIDEQIAKYNIEKENGKWVIVKYDNNACLRSTQLYELIDGDMGFWDIDNNFDTYEEAAKYLDTHDIM